MGYDSAYPSGAQYAHARQIVQSMAKMLGWKPMEVQAALWVAGKKRAVLEEKAAKGKTATEQQIKDAGLNYADALSSHDRTFAFEAVPSKDVVSDLPGIDYAPYAVKRQFSDDVLNNVVLPALKEAGLDDYNMVVDKAPGGYELKTNPAMGTKLPLPDWAADIVAGIIGYTTKQDSVLVSRYTNRGKTDATKLMFPKGYLNERNAHKFFEHVVNENPAVGGGYSVEYGDKGDYMVFYNLKGDDGKPYSGLSGKAWLSELSRVASTYPEDIGIDIDVESRENGSPYKADVRFVGNDWKENKDGEGYLAPIQRGRAGLAQDLGRHLARYESILADYAKRFGWNEDPWTGKVQPEGDVAAPIPVGGRGPGVAFEAEDGLHTNILQRFGRLADLQHTTEKLKIYNLDEFINDPELEKTLLSDFGANLRYFSFHDDPEAGVKFTLPHLKKFNYETGYVQIYDPRVAQGSFMDEAYTKAWRISHEIAHGITEKFMFDKYGKSRREGRLGAPWKTQRGIPGKQVEVEVPPLTLREALRAVEWEDVAFRAQREILKSMGVNISDAQFNREYNINISDAIYRSLTGDFGDPGPKGFIPASERPNLSDILSFVESAEQTLAAAQGREPTMGRGETWRETSDAEIREAISRSKEAKKLIPGVEDFGIAEEADAAAMADASDVETKFRRSKNPAIKTWEDTLKAGTSPLPQWALSFMKWYPFDVSAHGKIISAGKGTRAARDLANMIQRDQYGFGMDSKTGRIEDEGFHPAVQGATARLVSPIKEALNMLKSKGTKNLAKVLRGGYGLKNGKPILPTSSGVDPKAAAIIKRSLSDIFDYWHTSMIEGGADPKDLAPKLPYYWPQYWLVDGKFTDSVPALKGISREEVIVKWLAEAGIYNGNVTKIQSMIDKWTSDGAVDVTYGYNIFDALDDKISADYRSELERIFKFKGDEQYKIDIGGKKYDVSLSDLLDNDPSRALNRYAAGMIRKAEFARRFGHDGKKIDEMINKIDDELEARGDNHLSRSDRKIIVDQLKAQFGLLGRNFKQDYEVYYKVMSGIRLFTDFATLSLSALTSIPEVVMPAVRMGLGAQSAALHQNVRDLFRTPVTLAKTAATFTTADSGDRARAARQAYEERRSDMRAFAEDMVGTVLPSIHHSLMSNMEENSSLPLDKIRSAFFKANMLQPLTEFQRVGATAAAVSYIGSLKNKLAKNPKNESARRHLAEVGLNFDDVKNFDHKDYRATTNEQINKAIRQLVNETVLEPSRSDMPGWMADPRYMLISHIKSYFTTFNNKILQRVTREAWTHHNILPLFYLGVYSAIAAMVYEAREYIRWGEEGNPYYNKLGLPEGSMGRKVMIAFDRGGLWGPLQMYVDSVTGARIGRDPNLGSTLSPSVGLAENVLGGITKLLNAQSEKDVRAAVDDFSRSVPGVNMSGQYRSDLVTAITGIEGGRKTKSSSQPGVGFKPQTYKPQAYTP